MTTIQRLHNWFRAQCDGGWEHHHGISIETCDNPGWWVKIEIGGTALENRPFTPIEHHVSLKQMERISAGLEADTGNRNPDWMLCQVKENIFDGAGGPDTLEAILEIFLNWAENE